MTNPKMPHSLDPMVWATYGKEWRERCEEARAWAALWKRAAKLYHGMFHYIDKELRGPYAVILKAENQRQAAEIERLQFDYAEAMRQYNAQQKRACDAEAEIERLREALCQILAFSTDKRAADRAAREIGEARP